MGVIDGHCHVSSTRYIPSQFVEGLALNIHSRMSAQGREVPLRKVIGLTESQHQDHDAVQLVAEMDRAGVDVAVVLLADFTYVWKSDLTIEEMIAEHARIRDKHADRLRLFYGVDPRWGRDGIDLFERCIARHGLDGMKIYPPCGYSPSDPGLFPFYEICQHLGKPVLLHTGPTVPTLRHDCSHPSLIDDAARRFPGTNFVLAHGGVNNLDASAIVCAYRPNVFMDTSGYLGALHPGGVDAHLRDLFALGLNHKIVFGTDWPVFRAQGGQKLAVQRFRESIVSSGVRDVEARAILGGNMSALLDPPSPV